MKQLQKTIGYKFKDEKILEIALTHPSVPEKQSYQRLEFLGDSVLGLAIAEFLYNKFPNETEGSLAKRLAKLVSGETLVKIAREINLGQFLTFSEAEKRSLGADNKSNLEDALEALIGAIYLDGGFIKAQKFIIKYWSDAVLNMKEVPIDPKTALQELVQSKGMVLPVYETISTEGADHAPLFTVQVTIESGEQAVARGKSKKTAMKKAAGELLKKLG